MPAALVGTSVAAEQQGDFRVTPVNGLHQQARRLRRSLQLLWATLQDAWSFARGSGLLNDAPPAVRAAHALKSMHRLEKGWALPDPRAGFGQATAQLLSRQLSEHQRSSGADWVWLQGQATLQRYRAYAKGASPVQLGEPMQARTVQHDARQDFASLVRSRRSVRQFTGDPLPAGCLERAAELAAQSPSVCNRSGARLWVATTPDMRARALQWQDGHQGFADRAGAIAVITVDPSVFHAVGERHQAWIDGGLFAMTLVHALHHEGLGCCCLNWSVTPQVDRAFKRSIGLPPFESVVMLLAIGVLPAHYTVAHSPRRPISEVLRTLECYP
jgi:nitroreductase